MQRPAHSVEILTWRPGAPEYESPWQVSELEHIASEYARKAEEVERRLDPTRKPLSVQLGDILVQKKIKVNDLPVISIRSPSDLHKISIRSP